MNVIHLFTPKWSTQVMVDERKEPVCFASKKPDGLWSCVLTFPTNTPYRFPVSFDCRLGPMDGQADGNHGYVMKSWGLRKLGPGVWAVDPSINHSVPQLAQPIHGYVVLCDVPDPAPWE